jgi:hypothetical protein
MFVYVRLGYGPQIGEGTFREAYTMIDAAECRERAKECANHANTETTQELRSVYSNMARSWVMLANQIERQIEARRDSHTLSPEA